MKEIWACPIWGGGERNLGVSDIGREKEIWACPIWGGGERNLGMSDMGGG